MHAPPKDEHVPQKDGMNYIERYLSRCDKNKDGSLSLQEVTDCVQAFKGKKEDKIQKVTDLFGTSDLDNDGLLTGEEITNFVN